MSIRLSICIRRFCRIRESAYEVWKERAVRRASADDSRTLGRATEALALKSGGPRGNSPCGWRNRTFWAVLKCANQFVGDTARQDERMLSFIFEMLRAEDAAACDFTHRDVHTQTRRRKFQA